MGNIISSFFSGLGKVVGDLFGSPLGFLSGKSCSSVCISTWDLICYIENFCVANLLKMAMVLALSYIVLLFLYLFYKLGICWCIGHSLCKIFWACLVSWLSSWECCCTFFWHKLRKQKRTRRRHRVHTRNSVEEDFDSSSDNPNDGSYSFDEQSPRIRSLTRKRETDYRGIHLKKSLRPRRHNVQLNVSRDSMHRHSHRRNPIKLQLNHINGTSDHGIRVTQSSKFAKKDRCNNSRGAYRSRKMMTNS